MARINSWALCLLMVGCTPFEVGDSGQPVAPAEVESFPEVEEAEVAAPRAPAPVSAPAPAPEPAEDPVAVSPGRGTITAADYWNIPGDKDPASVKKQIAMVDRLLRATDPDDPDYPDLLFRLGTLHRELRLSQGSDEHAEDAARMFEAIVMNPAHARYVRRDEALFLFAAELSHLGRLVRMREVSLRLIKNHPNSRYVPHAFAVFADHYFDRGKYAEASRMYEKLAQFANSPLYAYAMYQLGHCHLHPIVSGEPRYDKSLNYFVNAIKATIEGRGGPAALAARIRKNARLDMTAAYALVAKPTKAYDFFKKFGVGPDNEDDVLGMMLALARQYRGAGFYVESTFLYKKLQSVYPTDRDACEWQWQVTRNALDTGNAALASNERASLEAYLQREPWSADPQCAARVRGAASYGAP